MSTIVIIGAGLAGLSCGLLLNKHGFEVTIVEKKDFPRHKVCGEYVSNEVLPFLESLEIDVFELGPSNISQLQLTTLSGRQFSAALPLGGFGLSRYELDNLLYQKAIQRGIKILTQTSANHIVFHDNEFQIHLNGNQTVMADLVIAAYGKRSNLDQKLNRNFFYNRSPYMGVKYHARLNQPSNLIRLHNFEGGYCGICKIENDIFNLCYLVQNRHLKRFASIKEMEKGVLFQNKALRQQFAEAEFLTEKPQVINEISFQRKQLVENHILFCGDASGMISPLCGNGMAMAMHSGKILGEAIIRYAKPHLNTDNRKFLELFYRHQWQKAFASRLKTGQLVQALFLKPQVADLTLSSFHFFPALAESVIRKTHGQPF